MTGWKTPLHLYVHIPFCLHKCPYCDFNSHVRSAPAWEQYQAGLLCELAYWSEQPQFQQRTLATLFFGGGTPSLAPAGLIEEVVSTAGRLFGLMPDAEISMEANPGACDIECFSAFRQAGVNRLSIGIQSFDDADLKWLERIHDSAEAAQTYEAARAAGYDNISLDLIYGLPGQSPVTWYRSLDTAIALCPEHMSCYQLTVEPGTLLAKRHRNHPLGLPEDEQALAFLSATKSRLAEAGFNAYEVSNFARKGFECRHNDGYWRYHDYIGIGAGASGKWDANDGGTRRYSNVKSPERYVERTQKPGAAFAFEEALAPSKAAAEAVWQGLRRTGGLDRAAFNRRFGTDVWAMFSAALGPWLHSGDLILEDADLRLSDQGVALADEVAASIL
jgi:oxygen-independent coproporphyrinogen-3 oxidase